MFDKFGAWLLAFKLKRESNRIIEAQKVIERNGFAMVKFEERAGTLYITNQKDGSLWRLKRVK